MKKRKKNLAIMTAFSLLVSMGSGNVFAVERTEEPRVLETEIQPSDQASADIHAAYHTKEEIREYLKNVDLNAATEYEVAASTKPPYEPGKLTEKSLNDALATMNAIRYVAGLDAVELDEDYNEKAQTAALVNAANQNISHYPEKPQGMEDSLYEVGYAASSKSNLAYTSWESGLSYHLIRLWMYDGDKSNISRVGHRRWILNPPMKKVGFGWVYDQKATYTVQYVNDHWSDPTEKSNIVWPAQTMPLEFWQNLDPWSISTGTVLSKEQVKVTLTRLGDGKQWSFSAAQADGDFYVENSNYGQKGCVIFRPSDIEYEAGDQFLVEMTGGEEPISYTVNFFQAKETGASDTGEEDHGENSFSCRFVQSTGELTVSGNGRLSSSEDGKTDVPWSEWAKQIKKVRFEGNITYIGNWLFEGCTQLSSVTFDLPWVQFPQDADLFPDAAENLVIYARKNSTAESFAKEKQYAYQSLPEIGKKLKVKAEGYTGKADGADHTISLEVEDAPEGTYTVRYALTDAFWKDGEERKNPLGIREVGTQTVYYYVYGDGYDVTRGSVTITLTDPNVSESEPSEESKPSEEPKPSSEPKPSVSPTIPSEESSVPSEEPSKPNVEVSLPGIEPSEEESVPTQPSDAQQEPSKPSLILPAEKTQQKISCSKQVEKVYGNKAFSLNARLVTGDGKLSYTTSNKKVVTVKNGKVTIVGTGSAIITIRAAETASFYAASVEVKIKVLPVKQTIQSAKALKGGKLKVTWKKDTKASGYQIVYSTDSAFRKAKKTLNIKKNQTTTATLKKLKKEKTYYIQIRAYKKEKVGGQSTTLYGAWSKSKKIKTTR
ncbi:MAG: CAP domain-containing protein [Lachnospiraceae bacterium]